MAWRTYTLGHFRVEEFGLTTKGHPTWRESAEAGEWLWRNHRGSPWRLGDYFNFIKSKFPERYSQFLEASGLQEGLLTKYGWVCANIPASRRPTTELAEDLDFTHFEVVAALAPAQQRTVLAEAKRKQWTISETRQHVRRLRRRPLDSGAAELAGQFRVVLADPDYERMSLEEFAKVPVAAHMQPNSAMFLWCPERLRFDIKSVLDALGFEHKCAFVWDRQENGGPHAYLDVTHEHLLIATRGHCPPDHPTPMLDSVISRRGPTRPPEVIKYIERLYDPGPYLVLFPGDVVPQGWTGYGPTAKAVNA